MLSVLFYSIKVWESFRYLTYLNRCEAAVPLRPWPWLSLSECSLLAAFPKVRGGIAFQVVMGTSPVDEFPFSSLVIIDSSSC